MKAASIIFPHHLFKQSQIVENDCPVYIVEEYLFFKEFNFHKQKIALHRASMKFYESYLLDKKKEVHYIESANELSDVRKLIPFLKKKNFSQVNIFDTADNWLEARIKNAAAKAGVTINIFSSPLFLNSLQDLKVYFNDSRKKFFQTEFYISERKKRKILVNEFNEPDVNKWSFDAENRKKFPNKKQPPKIKYPQPNEFYKEAKNYTEENFKIIREN